MDSSDNKAQAEKCVQIAQKAMEDKDWAKVRKSDFDCIQLVVSCRPNAFFIKA